MVKMSLNKIITIIKNNYSMFLIMNVGLKTNSECEI